MTAPIREALDWGKLAPLRVVARAAADGAYAGMHRSPRRGSGVEFGGHRNYVPGDDLRWLDRHALMRHGRLMVREFETETDRALRLVVDASQSMAYRGPNAPGSKLAYAAVLGAALGRIALAGGDPVALDWLGGKTPQGLPATGGRDAFERLIFALESVQPGTDLSDDPRSVDLSLAPVARRAGRGALVVLFSDLIDLPQGTLDRVAALTTRHRVVVVVQVLDPAEAQFTFSGPVRLRSLEGDTVIETDADAARSAYLKALDALTADWEERLLARGARLVRTVTNLDPIDAVRSILTAVRGTGP